MKQTIQNGREMSALSSLKTEGAHELVPFSIVEEDGGEGFPWPCVYKLLALVLWWRTWQFLVAVKLQEYILGDEVWIRYETAQNPQQGSSGNCRTLVLGIGESSISLLYQAMMMVTVDQCFSIFCFFFLDHAPPLKILMALYTPHPQHNSQPNYVGYTPHVGKHCCKRL